jgi:5-methyltetrahydrofolate--homocysteine methyltransferase
MREVFSIAGSEILPERDAVLHRLGIPPDATVSGRTEALVTEALSRLEGLALARGIWTEITGAAFDLIYEGSGRNAPETPLAEIHPRAEALALFAVTLGGELSVEVARLFDVGEYALASALDAAASEATERCGDRLEGRVARWLASEKRLKPKTRLLRYSPGYCGWHMSGQAALIRALQPKEIGISLRESFLMTPLKSMTGVVVAGPPEVHEFEPAFEFCRECRSRTCLERMRRLRAAQGGGMEILKRLAARLEEGDAEATAEETRAALAAGLAPKAILDGGLIAGMGTVGEKFRTHEIVLPDVLLAARAMVAAVEILKPLLAGGEVPVRGRVVLGTVQGDLHDIGKNLVGILLRGAGFDVVDLGHDVAPERFVEAARTSGARVIGLSALLTTTMPVMRQVVERVRAEKLAVRVIVGGAPVSAAFAREIGADDYGYDAASAVERVRALVG